MAIQFAPGEGPVAAKAAATAKSIAAAAALRKLQSGAVLTSAERILLGMSVIPPSPTTSNFNPITGSTVSQRAPAAPAPIAPAAAAPAPALAVEAPPVVQATPPEITADVVTQTVDTSVKAAPIDTVLFVDEGFSQEFITDLLFEDIAGQELLSIARDDTVNGQQVIYQPIKNLGILRDTYDVNNLLKLQETSDRFFANFLINLFEKIPKVGNGPDGKNYYFDETTGDGIIEFINMRSDEQVEIQISNAGIMEEVGI